MAAERMEASGSRELDRARRYEHAALARIFDRHYDAVHGFIFALLGDTVVAEEVSSLVFQRLLDALNEITGHGAGLEGWLYWTAYTLAVERRRRTRPEGVAKAVWELPADEREVLALRLGAGLDVERIAAATGRSPAAVMALQSNALRRLGRPSLTGVPSRPPREVERAVTAVLSGERGADPEDGGGEAGAARRVRSLPRPRAESTVRSLARDLFLAEADARRARWVHSHHVPAVAPPAPKKGIRFGQVTVLLIALLIAVTVGAVLAAGASFSGPDSSLYPVKRTGENILLALARDPVSRSNLEVNLSEERLREAEAMAAAGRPDLALDMLSVRYSELRDAGNRLAADQVRDSRWRDARGRFLDEAAKPVAPLQRQLQQKGYPTWAAQATAVAGDFAKYLDGIKPKLGVKASSSGASPTAPSPPAPSPSS